MKKVGTIISFLYMSPEAFTRNKKGKGNEVFPVTLCVKSFDSVISC